VFLVVDPFGSNWFFSRLCPLPLMHMVPSSQMSLFTFPFPSCTSLSFRTFLKLCCVPSDSCNFFSFLAHLFAPKQVREALLAFVVFLGSFGGFLEFLLFDRELFPPHFNFQGALARILFSRFSSFPSCCKRSHSAI